MSSAASKARGWAIPALALTVLTACTTSRDAERAGEAAARDQSLAARPGRVADMQPEELLGMSADRLAGLLGPADFTRNDGPAEIWQFRESECVLDVFLYRDPARGGYRVEHVQTRDRGLVRAADPPCVADLLRARRTPQPAS